MQPIGWLLLTLLSGSAGVLPTTIATDASVNDFSWLAGRWTGEGLGGTCEEVWAPPMGDAMVGTFRHVKDGVPVFYELLLLTKENEQLVLKVKHFSPDFAAWEEKNESVTFRLEKLTPERADFSGLVLARVGENGLRIEVSMRRSDGSTSVEVFNFKRAGPSPAPLR